MISFELFTPFNTFM